MDQQTLLEGSANLADSPMTGKEPKSAAPATPDELRDFRLDAINLFIEPALYLVTQTPTAWPGIPVVGRYS
jgi:hypothetical protein